MQVGSDRRPPSAGALAELQEKKTTTATTVTAAASASASASISASENPSFASGIDTGSLVPDDTPDDTLVGHADSDTDQHKAAVGTAIHARHANTSIASGTTMDVDLPLVVDDDSFEEEDDDGDDDDRHSSRRAPGVAESIYSGTRYTPIRVRYRVDRMDAATTSSSSRSLYDDSLDYIIENGRRYCGDYIFPNDELEQDRMRVLHQAFLHLFNFELTSVPLSNPTHILDIGTGTGEWAIGMAETFPNCEVVGVDISAIQPTAVPHNVFFEVDDCEIDWMRPGNSVDLVHLRDMAGAFDDWDFVYSQAFACLKPGGYIELLDYHFHPPGSRSPASVGTATAANSLDGPLTFLDAFPPDAYIHELAREINEALALARRRRDTRHLDAARLRAAGFSHVQAREHAISLNPYLDSGSKLWLIACLHSVEAGALRLLTKYRGWSAERALAACDQACKEIRARAAAPDADHLKIYLRVMTARKPTPEEAQIAALQTHGLSQQSLGPWSQASSVPWSDDNNNNGDESTDDSTING